MHIVAALLGLAVIVANIHYWFVLTPAERADDERDFPSWL